MTISNDSSAPLVVVVGATGTQGGSVVNNLEESDRPYRVRGLTRDVSKPAAQAFAKKGVEMVACDISVGKEKEVERAFEGAAYIFMVTNFWEHMDKAHETAQGKLMVDAAKAVGVKLLLVSSGPSVTKLSKGRLTKVLHFDSKAEFSDYARASGVPFVEIHVAGYMNNFATRSRPRPAGDGTYIIASTWKPELRMPLIDTYHDTGLFARLAIESDEFNKGDGKLISAYGEWMSVADQVRIMSEMSGKQINYVQLSDEQLGGGMKASGMPQYLIDDMLEMFRFHEDYWEQTYVYSNRKELARAPRTFKEYCQTEDWSKVLV